MYGVFSEYYKRLAFQHEQRAEHIKRRTDNGMCPKTLKKDKETIESSRRIGENFSFVPDSSSGNSCDCNDDVQGETVVYKNGTEVKSVNRVFLMISNPSDPAEQAKGCTCRESTTTQGFHASTLHGL